MMQDALVYLAAAVLCVPLAKRLGLGSMLGYLLAGVAIGPWGLRLVEDVESILHFAEFGVVLMLFVIGLELEPKRLWAMRAAVFGGGALQLALCGAALAARRSCAGLPLAGGDRRGSCPCALVDRHRHADDERAQPDALADRPHRVCRPAVPGHRGDPADGGGSAAGRARLPDGTRRGCRRGKPRRRWPAVLVIGRYLTRPVLRVIAGTNMREVFTAFALLLVIGIAQLMKLAGISMALGAFLAGVLLASSEYRHALETDIEPFKGLLMGLFFISVGMSIDFGLLDARPR